jgi:hypothetical protein
LAKVGAGDTAKASRTTGASNDFMADLGFCSVREKVRLLEFLGRAS